MAANMVSSLAFLLALVSRCKSTTNDISCKPREVLLPTAARGSGEFLLPQYAVIHRCGGIRGIYSTYLYKCLPTVDGEKTVSVEVKDVMGMKSNVKFINHTKCECVNCSQMHPLECDPGERWNAALCQCEAACVKTRHQTDDKSGKSADVSMATFIGSLAGELFAILLVVFLALDTCGCRRQKNGVIELSRQYIRRFSTSTKEHAVRISSATRDVVLRLSSSSRAEWHKVNHDEELKDLSETGSLTCIDEELEDDAFMDDK